MKKEEGAQINSKKGKLRKQHTIEKEPTRSIKQNKKQKTNQQKTKPNATTIKLSHEIYSG